MNSKELLTMITISKTASIDETAKILKVNRSSVTRRLQKLEKEFSTPLFIKSNHSLVPTYAGRIYIKTAKEILSAYDTMLENL